MGHPVSRAKRNLARGVMRRPNAVVRSYSHNRRVGQLDDVPELVDALAQTPNGTVQVPQNVVNLKIRILHSIHFRMTLRLRKSVISELP